MIASEATCRHEAAHAAAAIWLGGRKIRSVRVDEPDVGVPGMVLVETKRDLGPEDLAIALIGWMVDDERLVAWPPPWRLAKRTKSDGVGALVNHLGLDEAEYDEVVGLVEKLLADPDFKRLMGLIARALQIAPVLDTESVEILRRAAGIPDPQPEEVASAA
jgi:hypothetical protein